MAAVVTDTHALLWYLREPQKLSANAFSAIDTAIIADGPVFLSAISIVEICYFVEKARLPATALEEVLRIVGASGTGFVVSPVDLAVAQALQQIPRQLVPDMPDRIIAATAFHLGLPLVTRDAQIRSANITTIW
jgi:PIN domain nuclease of toxin-antitoxin system